MKLRSYVLIRKFSRNYRRFNEKMAFVCGINGFFLLFLLKHSSPHYTMNSSSVSIVVLNAVFCRNYEIFNFLEWGSNIQSVGSTVTYLCFCATTGPNYLFSIFLNTEAERSLFTLGSLYVPCYIGKSMKLLKIEASWDQMDWVELTQGNQIFTKIYSFISSLLFQGKATLSSATQLNRIRWKWGA